MAKDAGTPSGEGAKAAQRIKEEEELGLRRPQGWQLYLVPLIALCWSLFQLSIASWLLLDTTYIRAIHLAFALVIVFLSYPTLKGNVRLPGLSWLGEKHKIPIPDMILALLAALAALYIVLDYEGIAGRVGRPSTLDMTVGIFLVVVLLDAARRVIGPALPFIAGVFTIYAFFGPYMPDFVAFKGVSLARYVSQISLTTEGIFGIPLGVSARIVFLFVLFGALLDKAGAGKFFIDLAMSLLGRYKGGPAKAAVLASGMTGMVSGSSIANVVTTGTFTIPLMKKVGYPAKKAAAIEVAVSTNGQLMPPIMGAAAFIIAEYVNITYLEVVKAAAIPAFASYFALFFLTHLEASKLGMRGLTKAEMPVFFNILRSGFYFLVPILVLLYELIIPRHSPDLAAFRAILVLAVIMLFQHAVKAAIWGGSPLHGIKQGAFDILNGLISGGRNMVAVAVATAAAGIIVGVVTLGLGGLITDVINALSRGNLYLMLLITAMASLILGMGLPTTANYIVMATLTAPALVTIAGWQGFEVPLIAAHLFVFYFGILADDTPPVGLAAYAASAIARSEPIATGFQAFSYDIRTAVLPFMFIFNTDMLLIGVEGYFLPFYIFFMTCVGTFAFVSATQRWFVVRTRWYEIILLLGVALIMFRPGFFAGFVGVENHYLSYLVGLALYAGIFALQTWRARRQPAAA
ncbi:TRAP transporter, 4TM/12TM fusion protein [Geoalkalibacter ferrihydriticus]|uniref:C4-dicarboxylate ABC transporter n=2 Tax=Geoalkalibacter ferrihydriticus TaxID=392333 RepID=A0A0C2HLU8_9BACT|nr:TRAP transporter permease [Geoalkalibacter ferrihydriticus]KIH75960.1 C4-dicarboxylate ABC transporter [Geoalkalibacter ferrihydriticus DSM 17813]SDM57093.1 TRAP transporter, 4TM/12TM fusion protein [Geoalkalibacter ferrihydriticus]